MKSRKFRSSLKRSQQNGIFLLIGIILIAFLSFAYYNHIYEIKDEVLIEVDSTLQSKVDSLKRLKAKEKTEYKQKIYPFNPNFLKEGKAYRIGLSANEFERLAQFRAKNKWINSAEDFQKVTQVSDKLLTELKQYFKFPDWVIAQQKEKSERPSSQKLSFEQKGDLNKVSAEKLEEIDGIGSVLSERIIRYRSKIQAFRSDIQLKDIYGLKSDIIQNITDSFTVKTIPKTEKININTASLIELAEIPYFDYELAREIYQFIKINEGISNFEELSKIQQFPSYKIDRIKLYLTIIE